MPTFSMLPPTASALWETYTAAEALKIRRQALAALDAFLAELASLPPSQWHPWALHFAAVSSEPRSPTPIRMPLFRDALFPVLLHGLNHGAPHCARILARLFQLIYQGPDLCAQLPQSLRWPTGLLRRALDDDPADVDARDFLLSELASQLNFALHELPAGVLYSQNSAIPEQCLELLTSLDELEALAASAGKAAKYEALIAKARFHIPNYRDYLLARCSGDSYAGWLLTHPEPETHE